MALAETAELAVRISLKDNVSAGVRGLQKNLGGLNRSLAQTGRGFGQIGTGIARAGLVVGGAAIAGLTGAAKAAIDFEDAFAGVRKTVDETQLAAAGLTFEALARQFRDMATEIPIAATELARIGETAGALGIKAQDIDDFTKTVALLGETTDLTSDAAAEALGKVGTILGLTGSQFEDFADVLVNLGNQGASTESEIIEVTKRFAAMGKQAGLATPEILALASAATSLGAEPEAAGSALSRIFANMSTEIALASDKGKAFSKITGRSIKDLSRAINEGNALPVLLDFLEGLQGLSRTDAAKALRAAGIANVRDRDAILKMAQNLGFVNDQLRIAQDSAGALGKEAQKRFDTVASKIKLLRNNLTEAAITLGEGFAPAIGRAAEKLSAFLRVDANRSRLKGLGEDIGRAIDNIDWAAVLTGAEKFVGLLQGALSFAKLLFDAFMALPGPIKEAAAGFLVLNKLSGGLVGAGVGNVVGGLGGAALQGVAARAPGVGRLFAQPVFVTNWPLGFGTGGPLGVAGGKGATGILGKLIGLSVAGAIISLAVPIGEAFASALPAELKGPGGAGESESQRRIREGREQMERDRAARTLGPPRPQTPIAFQGPERLGPPTPKGLGQTFANAGGRQIVSVASVEAALQRGLAKGFKPTRAAAEATVQRNLERLAAAQNAKTDALRAEVGRTTAATLMTAAAVQNLDRTQRPPIVNVTTNVSVSATNTVQKFIQIRRSGPSGGSRERSGPLAFDR